MSTIINGTSSAITFPDSSVQNTSAIVSGYVPYANLPAGSVLQTVSTTTNSSFVSSSSSLTDTGFTLSITPKFSTSKILVRIIGGNIQSTSANAQPYFTIYRGATQLYGNRGLQQSWNQAGGFSAPLSMETLDSPATTSSTAYKLYMAVNSVATGINYYDSAYLTITLMEIAA